MIKQYDNLRYASSFNLRKASYHGHLEIVKNIVEDGVDIHVFYDEPLRMACAGGHLEVVKYLISKGADIHAYGDYSLNTASKHGHLEVVKYLISLMEVEYVIRNLPQFVKYLPDKYSSYKLISKFSCI